MNKGGFVYILSSRSRVLYVGVTSNLEHRIWEHKSKIVEGFTSKYNVDRLVYFETFEEIEPAIAREKQIKRWRRAKKLDLVRTENPHFSDLSQDWYRP